MPRNRKTPTQLKRKYNATYRLRQKIGINCLAPYSKIIHSETDDNIEETPEGKLLLKEFGFIIKLKLFTS